EDHFGMVSYLFDGKGHGRGRRRGGMDQTGREFYASASAGIDSRPSPAANRTKTIAVLVGLGAALRGA
ncbi:MAG: hypothetical protein O7G84_19815, partial [Gammaproteobacteria bacterium]|nr:hypothetical protein [Gammaproteobacteria bacterium]